MDCKRVVNIWNRLPVDIVDVSSLSSFRISLDAMDMLQCSQMCN